MTTQRSSAPRRRMAWTETVISTNVLGAGGQIGHRIFGPEGQLSLVGATITRILFNLSMLPETGETGGDMGRLDYGMTMVDEDAATAGAFPDPAGSDTVPWVMRDMRILVNESTVRTPQSLVVALYDLSSQRILRSARHSLYFIMDNTTISGAITARYEIHARTLYKLP